MQVNTHIPGHHGPAWVIQTIVQRVEMLLLTVFAPRYWTAFGDAKTGEWKMRRWVGGAWEVRDATDEEAADANAMRAVK